MALNAKRRQKKMAKKAFKRKAKESNRNRMKKTRGVFTSGRQMALAANSPVHECYVSKGLFEIGIGNVVLSRKMPDGNIAFSIFLVDTFCLGIKNALFAVRPQSDYDDKINNYKLRENLEKMHPSCVRKLIERAVAYAKDLGFNPHPDYRLARQIFGDIDREACPMSFEFGRDGKPWFIAGPYDTPEKCKMILNTLKKRFGKEDFHYVDSEDN